MRTYGTLVKFRLRTPQPAGVGWSPKAIAETSAWCTVASMEPVVSGLADRLTETKSLTLRARYNPCLMLADSAVLPNGEEYRVVSRLNVAELSDEVELVIQNAD